MSAKPLKFESLAVEKELEKYPAFLNIYQLATILQVSHITVRRWIKSGQLEAINTSEEGTGRWRIPKASINEFLSDRSSLR
jgi:excisionase family DNA binding protein